MTPFQRWQYGDPIPAMAFFPPARPIPIYWYYPIEDKHPTAAEHYMVHNPNAAPRA